MLQLRFCVWWACGGGVLSTVIFISNPVDVEVVLWWVGGMTTGPVTVTSLLGNASARLHFVLAELKVNNNDEN